jgi:cell division protein FtsZ
MKGQGEALMGIGFGSGENRAKDAVASAIDNPLLEDTSIDGATKVLVNIAGSEDISLVEVDEIVNTIKAKADMEVNIIHGVRIDSELKDIQVTVIATGFKDSQCAVKNSSGRPKNKEPDFIDYGEYVRLRERTKRPEYLGFLPQREYQDDLDVPAVIRNHDYQADGETGKRAEIC